MTETSSWSRKPRALELVGGGRLGALRAMLDRMLDGRGECGMVELSLAMLGAEALSEGIKFLYAQAGEVLKRWWAHKDEADAKVPLPTPDASAELFAGQLQPLVVHLGAVAPLRGELEQLMQALTPYAQGRPVEPGDENLLRATDGLRRALEAVFQQRITFRGEERAASGPVVSGEITAGTVAGELAGVVADVIEGGALVHGRAKAGDVQSGGSAAGVRAKRIGP